MKLLRARLSGDDTIIAIVDGDQVQPLDVGQGRRFPTLASLLEAESIAEAVSSLQLSRRESIPLSACKLLPPIDQQEVWAAGVTYRRSRAARMEESVGAAVFYDKVYDADRPELFFKATPHRVVGPGRAVRIRGDAKWNVPEPELALVLNSKLRLVGFTIANDMSSRDIEGENPLYLPQAKLYDASCALGPWILVADDQSRMDQAAIHLQIRRAGAEIFAGETSTAQMASTFTDLIHWLGRDNSFPNGAFLLTGTGIVPGDQFSLQPGDVVDITIAGIGTLSNPVERIA